MSSFEQLLNAAIPKAGLQPPPTGPVDFRKGRSPVTIALLN